eukprot:gene25404-27540_t
MLPELQRILLQMHPAAHKELGLTSSSGAGEPSFEPIPEPTYEPTYEPTPAPVTSIPTFTPSLAPSGPSASPSEEPTYEPYTEAPSAEPTAVPTQVPTTINGSIIIYINVTVPVPCNGTAAAIRNAYTAAISSAVGSGSYLATLRASLTAIGSSLFSSAVFTAPAAFTPGTITVVSVAPTPKLSVQILSAQFEQKSIPVRQSAT